MAIDLNRLKQTILNSAKKANQTGIQMPQTSITQTFQKTPVVQLAQKAAQPGNEVERLKQFFKPAQEVRARDVVRETPAAAGKVAMSILDTIGVKTPDKNERLATWRAQDALREKGGLVDNILGRYEKVGIPTEQAQLARNTEREQVMNIFGTMDLSGGLKNVADEGAKLAKKALPKVKAVADDLLQEAKKYKSAEEFIEAAKKSDFGVSREVAEKTIFKDVKPGDGVVGVKSALTDFWNKAQTPQQKITAKKVKQGLAEQVPAQRGAAKTSQPLELSDSVTPPSPQIEAGTQKLQQELAKDLASKNTSDVFYNVDKYNISDAAKQTLKKEIGFANKEIGELVGQKLTNKEVGEIADTSSKVLSKTVSREQTAEKIAANLNLRRKLAAAAESGKIDESFIEAYLVDKSVSADIARQLQARRIAADPLEQTGIEALLDSIRKTGAAMDDVIEAAKTVDFNDAQQVAEFYRKFVKPNWQDWLDLLRYNSMLTSPNTHMVNLGSNYAGTGVITPIEKAVEGGLDALRVAMFGGDRKALAGEGLAYMKGYYSNVGKAYKEMVDTFTGKLASHTPDLRDMPLIPKGSKKIIESSLRTPLRVLSGVDRFFTTVTQSGVESALKFKEAGGIKVGNIERTALKEARERIFQGELVDKADGPLLNAVGSVSNVVNMARNSDNPILRTMARFTFPFVNTPTNLLKQGIEYSPFGVLTMAGAKNGQRQLAKAMLGTGMAVSAASLIGDDRLSWGYPTAEDEKKAWDSAGRKAYSVKVGDKWVPYNRIHPAIGMNFAIAAAIDDAQKNKKLSDSETDTLLAGLSKWYQFFADQSMMKGMGDFLRTAQGDIQGPARVISNYATQLIPFRAFLGWTERLVDPTVRQADPDGSILDKQLQYIAAQIPGLSSRVKPKLTLDGEPVVDKMVWTNAFSPVGAIGQEDKLGEAYYKNLKEIKKEAKNATEIKAAKREQIKSIYDKVKELDAVGNEVGAQALVDMLSDEDYKVYKSIKSSDVSAEIKALEPKILPIYRQVKNLEAAGYETTAQEVVDGLTDDEYKAYKSIKSKLSQ